MFGVYQFKISSEINTFLYPVQLWNLITSLHNKFNYLRSYISSSCVYTESKTLFINKYIQIKIEQKHNVFVTVKLSKNLVFAYIKIFLNEKLNCRGISKEFFFFKYSSFIFLLMKIVTLNKCCIETVLECVSHRWAKVTCIVWMYQVLLCICLSKNKGNYFTVLYTIDKNWFMLHRKQIQTRQKKKKNVNKIHLRPT